MHIFVLRSSDRTQKGTTGAKKNGIYVSKLRSSHLPPSPAPRLPRPSFYWVRKSDQVIVSIDRLIDIGDSAISVTSFAAASTAATAAATPTSCAPRTTQRTRTHQNSVGKVVTAPGN